MNDEALSRDARGLQLGAARYRSLIEASSQIVWTNSPDGEMVGEQPGWASITGQSYEEYQGFGWSEAIHPDDRQSTIDRWKEALAETKVFTTEHRVQTPEGTWRTYSVRAVPVFEDDGVIREWVGVHTDVTEQRELQRRADELGALYRALVETLPFQVWSATPDGDLDYVSPTTAEFFGRTPEQLVGEGWQNVVHPADLPGVTERWSHSIATGEPYHVEFRLLRGKDLSYRWHDGRIVKWIGSNADIDEQKRALEVRDAALARAAIERARTARVLDHAPSVVALYRGPEHTIVMVNSKWEEFVGKKNVIGKPIREVFPELEGQGIVELLDVVLATGEAMTTSNLRVMLDRDATGTVEETYWDLTLQPLVGDRGTVDEIVAYAVEITETVRLRREVEELRRGAGIR